MWPPLWGPNEGHSYLLSVNSLEFLLVDVADWHTVEPALCHRGAEPGLQTAQRTETPLSFTRRRRDHKQQPNESLHLSKQSSYFWHHGREELPGLLARSELVACFQHSQLHLQQLGVQLRVPLHCLTTLSCQQVFLQLGQIAKALLVEPVIQLSDRW